MTEAGTAFERIVSDFCRRRWSSESVRENRQIQGREVDVFIETTEEIIFIEVTTERTKKKAENDISKIRDLRKALIGDATTKPVYGFFITQHEPTPDIHKVAEENGSWIKAYSFPGFVNKFNSSQAYLSRRDLRPFGSVRNPANGSTNFERNQYVNVPFKVVGSGQGIHVDQIVDDILSKKRIRYILTGDFGVGKSMTFRELYFRLADKYKNGEFFRFPIYINLQDGAFEEEDDAVDLIERHAKWVGMRDERDKLVHAWMTDCCVIFLDGFDEIVRSGFSQLTTSSKDIRFSSSKIVRTIVKSSPPNTPIFVSGRESYFADFDEMKGSLGAEKFSHVSLHDLNDREVRELYKKILPLNNNPIVFEWVPQKPLLLSYLYFSLKDRIHEAHALIASNMSPGEGWNSLFDQLCSRETEVAQGAEPLQIRRLLERVALFARTNVAQIGVVTSLHVAQAFRDVFGKEPGMAVQQVLMRLPGLTAGRANEERSFIDSSFFQAAQSGALVELIEALSVRDRKHLRSDFVQPLLELFKRTITSVTPLCAEVVTTMLRKRDGLQLLKIALREASGNQELNKGNLLADLLVCACECPSVIFDKEFKSLVVTNSHMPELELTQELAQIAKLTFRDCIIESLEISMDPDLFDKIQFDQVRVGSLLCSKEASEQLQQIGLAGRVEKLVIFDATNADILDLASPEPLKALKITLRKLFRQHGSGRMAGAFYRGIGQLDPKLIERCLAALLRHKLVYLTRSGGSGSTVWHPNRAHSKRANFLIDAVSVPDDIIVTELLDLA